MEIHRFREPWVAVTLSYAFPGAGYFYADTVGVGVVAVTTFLFIIGVGLWNVVARDGNTVLGLFLSLASILFWIGMIVHSFFYTRRKFQLRAASTQAKKEKNPFLALFLSLLVPGLGHFYGRAFLPAVVLMGLYLWYQLEGYARIPWYVAEILVVLVALSIFIRLTRGERRPFSLAVIVLLITFASKITSGSLYEYTKNSYFSVGTIGGPSMLPTLREGESLLFSVEGISRLSRGQIVLFESFSGSQLPFTVKRVVAFEGETVEIKDGGIYIDGEGLHEKPFDSFSYTIDSESIYALPGAPYRVPNGSVFVLGDNARESADSRRYGAIQVSRIKRVCYKILWPIKRIRTF